MNPASTLEEAYEGYDHHPNFYDTERNKAVATKSTMPPLTPMAAMPINYYDVGGMSTIDVIKSKLSKEQFTGFLLGNVVKYSLRLNHKGDAKKDAAKLMEYSKWLYEHTTHQER